MGLILAHNIDQTPEDLTLLITDLAKPVLREHGLLMRPIPFFDRLEAFEARELRLATGIENHLRPLDPLAAQRVLRSYAFADELTSEVLRNFCPEMPQEGERTQRLIWGAAVLIDQLLDEEDLEPDTLKPVRDWIAPKPNYPGGGDEPKMPSKQLRNLVAMLEDIQTACALRSQDQAVFGSHCNDLKRLLDVELSSVNLPVREPPDKNVRTILYDKSVLLVWVGFKSSLLGTRMDHRKMKIYREICQVIGEVLWILDDLVDLEEDLERGIWNRSLLKIYDRIGEVRFGDVIRSKDDLADVLEVERIVDQEVLEIARRIEFLESHAGLVSRDRLRSMFSFWVTSWLGVYE